MFESNVSGGKGNSFKRRRILWLFLMLVCLLALRLRAIQVELLLNHAYVTLSSALVGQGGIDEFDKAERELHQVTDMDADNVSALSGLLLVELSQGKVEEAQKTLSLLGFPPYPARISDFAPSWIVLTADKFIQVGSVDRAESTIRLLNDLGTPGVALLQLGKVYQTSGKSDLAEKVYRQLIQNYPGEVATAYLALGQLYYEQRRLAESVQAYESALNVDPSVAYQSYWGMGQIGMLDSAPVAEKWFLRAADVVPPGHLRLLAYLQIGNIYGIWCGDQCRYDVAEKYLELASLQDSIYQDAVRQAQQNLDYVRHKLAESKH